MPCAISCARKEVDYLNLQQSNTVRAEATRSINGIATQSHAGEGGVREDLAMLDVERSTVAESESRARRFC